MTSHLARGALALSLLLVGSATPAQDGGGGGFGGFDLTVHGGVDKYDAIGFKSGLNSTDFTDAEQMRDASQTYGATAILRFGALSVGALAERGRPGRANATTTIGALAGLNLPLGRLQLDALGELGGQRYGDALHDPGVIVDSDRADWLAYVGLRPGISIHLGERGGLLVGIWGYARWDVMEKDVKVTLANGTGNGTYTLGGTQLGAALRLGFSL
jgi:hypothetical protein